MLKMFIGMVIVVGACGAAFAMYRGWFSLWGRAGSPWSDKLKVGLTVDPSKAKADVRKVERAVDELRD